MKLKENSRQALRIAKMELNTMFYSPVAWLILVVFAFHTGLIYADLLNDFVHQQAMGKKTVRAYCSCLREIRFLRIDVRQNVFFGSNEIFVFVYPVDNHGSFE